MGIEWRPTSEEKIPTPFRSVAYVGNNNTLIFPTGVDTVQTVCPGCGKLGFLILNVGPFLINQCFFCQKKNGLPIGLHPSAVVKLPRIRKEPKPDGPGLTVLGYVPSTHLIGTAATCFQNDLAATLSRTLKNTPPINSASIQNLIHPTLDQFLEEVFEVREWEPEEREPRDIIRASSLPSKSKKECLEALEEFQFATDQFQTMGSPTWRARWEAVTTNLRTMVSKCFVKKDKDRVGEGKNKFRARTIYSMPALFIALTLVVFHRWQGNCEKKANEQKPVCFAAGKTPAQRAEWRSQAIPGGRWFATDSTNWDSLMKGEVMSLGMRAYRYFARFCPSIVGDVFWWLLRHQKFTMKGITSCGIRWAISGVQKSGAFDTCLLNSIVNIILHCYAVAHACNITVFQLLRSGFLLTNLGDDILFYIPPHLSFDQTVFVDTMRDWGIDLKFEDEPEKREIFLNCVPVPATTGLDNEQTVNCSDGPVNLPEHPESIKVDIEDGTPYSSRDTRLAVVAGSCYGKTTLKRAARALFLDWIYDPDDYFPPGHNFMTTQEKYQKYLAVARSATRGLFLFHHMDLVPKDMRCVVVDLRDEEFLKKRALKRQGVLGPTLPNHNLIQKQILRSRPKLVKHRNWQRYCLASLKYTTQQLCTLPRVGDGSLVWVDTMLPGRGLARMGVTSSVIKSRDDHLAQVVECVWPDVAHHPIWNAYCRTLWRNHTNGDAPRFFERQAATEFSQKRRRGRIAYAESSQVWDWMSTRYSLSQDELHSVVEFLERATSDTNLSVCVPLVRVIDLDLHKCDC